MLRISGTAVTPTADGCGTLFGVCTAVGTTETHNRTVTHRNPNHYRSKECSRKESQRRATETTAESWVVHPEFSAFAEREGLTMEACIRCHHSRHVFALQVVAALRFDWIVQLHCNYEYSQVAATYRTAVPSTHYGIVQCTELPCRCQVAFERIRCNATQISATRKCARAHIFALNRLRKLEPTRSKAFGEDAVGIAEQRQHSRFDPPPRRLRKRAARDARYDGVRRLVRFVEHVAVLESVQFDQLRRVRVEPPHRRRHDTFHEQLPVRPNLRTGARLRGHAQRLRRAN